MLPFDAKLDGGVMERFPNYYGPWVRAIEKAGDTVYLGGAFATVAGHPQTYAGGRGRDDRRVAARLPGGDAAGR